MDSLLVTKIRAELMDIGPVEIKMSYDLTSENGDFALRGTLEKMALRLLNDIIESGAKISLKLGVINRFDFNIVGNDYEGNGEDIVRYEGLELELLNKEIAKDQNAFRKIGSFLANKVVIKSNNPNKRGELKKGTVYYLREPHKSIFKYWWKLIFRGLNPPLQVRTLKRLEIRDLKKKMRVPASPNEPLLRQSSKKNTPQLET